MNSKRIPVLITWDVDPSSEAPLEARKRSLDVTLDLCRDLAIPTTFFVTANAEQAQTNTLLRMQAEGQPDEGYVFRQPSGGPVQRGSALYWHKRILKAAGLPEITLHELRHTVGTLLAEFGHHPKTIADLLGHSTTQITNDFYTHTSAGIHEAAVDQLGEATSSGCAVVAPSEKSENPKPAAGEPVLDAIQEAFASNHPAAGNFDRTIPAEFLFRSANKKLQKLPGIDESMKRFEALFSALNACL